ncbi:MAG TPA: Ig-like domain-containing protein, partial [Gemmatimonadales bacterium]|nr:Ig-like domain-containing protein [Gemmatimonadales bacterium]
MFLSLSRTSRRTLPLLVLLAACGTTDPAEPTPAPPPPPPPPPVAVVSVEITPGQAELHPGGSVQFSARGLDAQGAVVQGRQVAWSSTSATVATVSNTGLVTAVAEGSTTIKATIDGKSASRSITVVDDRVPVASIEITTTIDTIEATELHQYSAIIRDAEGQSLSGRAIVWTSSNPAVATIGLNGMLTGVDRGNVTITATSEGKQDQISLEVVIRYRSVALGTMHACDLASGGIAWCWGLNGNDGRIGMTTLGPTARSTVPVRVQTDQRFTQLASFGRHTCGLTAAGKIWCWGYNGWGALGAGSALGQSAVPLPVAPERTFRT